MIDRVDFKKYSVPRYKKISEMVTKDIEIYRIDFEVKDVRLINKYTDCDGYCNAGIMYLVKRKQED